MMGMFGRGDWPRQGGWREVVFVLVVGKMTTCRPGIFCLEHSGRLELFRRSGQNQIDNPGTLGPPRVGFV